MTDGGSRLSITSVLVKKSATTKGQLTNFIQQKEA